MLPGWTSIVATTALLLLAVPDTLSQSNYASHANDVAYIGDGLPESATLDGKVTKLDDLSSVIFLNRTKATLNCGAGSMQVELKFNDPFYGIAYADFDRNSACQVVGKGDISYSLDLPLKGCGTKQVGWKQSLGLVSFRTLTDIVRILLGFLRGHFEHPFRSFGVILSFRILRGRF